MLIRNLFLVFLMTLSMSSFASTCDAIKIDADVINNNSVKVVGQVNKSRKMVYIEVYRGNEFLGMNKAVSSSNGAFYTTVRTTKRASMRPDINVYCLR